VFEEQTMFEEQTVFEEQTMFLGPFEQAPIQVVLIHRREQRVLVTGSQN
jgi:hypothetical protein